MFNRSTLALLVVLSFALLDIPGAFAQETELECIADTMFSGHSSEHNTNCGKQTWLRVKGWQGIVVFRFDMSELEGSLVEDATLKVFCSGITGNAASPLALTDLQISTIASDWIEGDGNLYTPTEDASTYDYPGGDLGDEWAEEDFDGLGRNGVLITVEDVINGTGDSILNSLIDKTIFEVGKWTEIKLDPELVQSLVDGEQYGIVVWQPDVGKNLDLASREEAGGQNTAVLIVRARRMAVEPSGKLASTWGDLKL
jgi:hypothetical protein